MATLRVTPPTPSEISDDLATIRVEKPAPSPTQAAWEAVSVMGANPDSPIPFEFGRRIAQGGMGAILEGSDSKLGRKIAVKVMLDADASADQKQRFVQEAAVLGRLEHPNIVPIHDLGRDSEGALYYTMKLVKGVTLQDIIDRLRREDPETLEHYTLDRLLTVFRKVCDALAFAHAQNIIHRDLKPENIMVGEFGEVLVMDWGIAKILGELGSEEVPSVATPQSPPLAGTGSFTATMDGAVMGTPNYMSPEQAMGKVYELDERSDIFSLGGILYAILTLRPPVEGKDVWEVLEKVQMGNITSPTLFGTTTSSQGKAKPKGEVLEAKKITPLPHVPGGRVPPALSAVAMKALTLDKAKRYQHVAAFSADIEAFQGGFATSAEGAGLAKQLMLLIKRNKGIFSTAAAACLLIVGLAVWFILGLRASEKAAKDAQTIAVQEKETARQALAKSQLDLAEKEFERGKFIEAQKILDETPESFRDANWRFLQAHSRDFTAQISFPGKASSQWMHFLPQGDRFAVRCYHGFIGVFTLTGQQVGGWLQVQGGARGKQRFAFGIDHTGTRIAFPASANEVAVQELATGRIVHRWTCEFAEIEHVLLSPDGGTVLATGGKKLIAYSAETGAPLWTQPLTGVIPAFSPDGRTVAVLASKAGLDLKVQLLDTTTGAVSQTLEATADNPTKTILQFNRLACLGGDEAIVWNAQTGVKIRALHFPGETVSQLSPAGDVVATFSGSRIRLWDSSGRLLRSLNGADTDCRSLAFSPDGKVLLSSQLSSNDGVINVWPTRLGEEIAAVRPVTALAPRNVFNHDGSSFYTGGGDGATAWDINTGLKRWNFSQNTARIVDLAIHPIDGSIILSEASGKPTFSHVSSTGEVLEALGEGKPSSLQFNRGGQLLLAVNAAFETVNPGTAFSVMEYPSGQILGKVSFEDDSLQPFAAFCLDDAAVATAALAGGITVWDWQAGTPLRQIDAAQTGSIACLASSPDGRHLASGGPDRWVRVWDAATGRLVTAFRAHWEGVGCVKFSPDGREILSGSDLGAVRIHDAVSGEERLAFYGLAKLVGSVDFSADGSRIAAIAEDRVAKVWDRQISAAAARLPEGLEAPEKRTETDLIEEPPAKPAESKPTPPAPANAAAKMDRGEIFDRIDTENAGKITRERFTAFYLDLQLFDEKGAAARLDHWDMNHDGFLSREEFIMMGRKSPDAK